MARRGSLRGSAQARLRIGMVLIVMVLSVFGARLVQLQGFDPGHYAAAAAREDSTSVILPASRGEILDRNGEPLADSIDGEMVVADPSLTSDHAARLATLLVKKLHVDYFDTLSRLRTPGSRFEYIARQVPAAQADAAVAAARARGLSGLDTRNDPIRSYPGKDIAANLVGFLGVPGADGSAQPLAGLESSFNNSLAGTDGSESYAVGGGNRIPLGNTTLTKPVNGQDLHLTIDRDLQFYVQRVLQQTVQSARGDSGEAIVLDTKTGEILSLADYPTYDASNPPHDKASASLLKSAALSNVYEPGSVEKVLTVSGLIDAGLVTDKTRFDLPNELDRQDAPIHDYFDHGTNHLHLTMAGIIAKSSNIGTVLASDRYKKGQLRRYLTSFGLGQRTNIGIDGETKGLLPSGSAMTSQVEDRMDFGQSLSVNALQMAAAVNTIANGGVRIDPSLIEGTATDDAGQQVGTGVATKHRVVSTDAALQMMRMMERVVAPDGVGVAPGAQVPGYRVAGKTGTAQAVGPDGRYDGTFTVSFAGFAPSDDPRFTVYVVVHNPRNGGGGGSVGGPAFAKIMGYALRRYGVPPTGTKASTLPVEW